MLKKAFSFFLLLLVAGFSFFYTEKAIKIARNSDPIMQKINESKNDFQVALVNPIINNDEYVSGINGCKVDEQLSYTKMKEAGSYNENLLVLKEEAITESTKNKYIIGGNKKNRKVSIIFIVNEEIDSELYNFIKIKKQKINYFISGDFIENNLVYVQNLSNYGNIYNHSINGKYYEKYMIYYNNLIETISNNKSNYCLTDEKNKENLKVCNDYDMNMIKSEYINAEVFEKIKNQLENGKILVLNGINKNVDEIKVSINHILSKGYDIVTLDDLLNENNDCKY